MQHTVARHDLPVPSTQNVVLFIVGVHYSRIKYFFKVGHPLLLFVCFLYRQWFHRPHAQPNLYMLLTVDFVGEVMPVGTRVSVGICGRMSSACMHVC